MRYLLTIIFLISYPLFSLDVTNYHNEFSQISGMHESQEHGFFIANLSGLYMMDKETGTSVLIPYKEEKKNIPFQYFFEYKSELYCYKEGGSLYRITNGQLEFVLYSVVAHYVKDEKLFLLRSSEPRIQVFKDDEVMDYYVGDGVHLLANLCEVNDEVYGFMWLNMSGTVCLFKIMDNGPKYIMYPNHSGYAAFKDLFPREIYNVNNELWLRTSKGMFKFEDDSLVDFEDDFTFKNEYPYCLHYENQKIYGINRKGIYIVDLTTKETSYLTSDTLDYTNDMKLVTGENRIYFLVDDHLYKYDLLTKDFKRLYLEGLGQIFVFIEGTDQNLLIAKDNLIEWYNGETPTILGGGGLVSNTFFGITNDSFNNRIVALGINGEEYILQTFDGFNWDSIPIPNDYPYSEGSIMDEVNVLADNDGNYYVGIEDYFGIWDGDYWERISLLSTPIDTIKWPSEDYYVLCLDSSGGVWVSAYLREYSWAGSRYNRKISIIRISESGSETIEEDIDVHNRSIMVEGICLKDGTVVLNSMTDEIYYYNEGAGNFMVPPMPPPKIIFERILDGLRTLCQDSDGNLVIIYRSFYGFSTEFGTIRSPGGISTFDGQNWDHNYLNDIAQENEVDLRHGRVLYDTYGNNYIFSETGIIRIGLDESIVVFPINELNFRSFFRHVQIENAVWATSEQNGLYKVELPAISSVNESTTPDLFLKNQIVEDGILELSIEIDDYQLYTISGQLVGKGLSKSTIDVSTLCNGTYFIVCQTNEKPVAQKFVISR